MTARIFLLVVAGLVVGCSSSSSGTTTDGGSTTDTGATGGDACAADCDRQAAAGCSKTPAGYADSCKLICGASLKAIKPECAAQFEAIYECAKNKITYSCSDAGVLQITPSGACAAEGAACASCNGGKFCSAVSPGG